MPPAVGTQLWVKRRKWPDGAHYEMQGIVLGDDEHGVWLGSRQGTLIRMPSGALRPGDHDAVWCAPHDDWFLLHFWDEHPAVEIYVDICTPARWSATDVVVIDLDFDVIRWNAARGGGVELVDEDEFELHRVQLDYPQQLQDDARRAARDVLERVRLEEPPFNRASAEAWLKRLLQLTA